jgi:hypothetical protein
MKRALISSLLIILVFSACVFRKLTGPASTQRGGINQSGDRSQSASDSSSNSSALKFNDLSNSDKQAILDFLRSL